MSKTQRKRPHESESESLADITPSNKKQMNESNMLPQIENRNNVTLPLSHIQKFNDYISEIESIKTKMENILSEPKRGGIGKGKVENIKNLIVSLKNSYSNHLKETNLISSMALQAQKTAKNQEKQKKKLAMDKVSENPTTFSKVLGTQNADIEIIDESTAQTSNENDNLISTVSSKSQNSKISDSNVSSCPKILNKKKPTPKIISQTTVTGTVKFFDIKNKFGFITYNDGTKIMDVFVHATGISKSKIQNIFYRTLLRGENVKFDLTTLDNGKIVARNVSGPNDEEVTGMPVQIVYRKNRNEKFNNTVTNPDVEMTETTRNSSNNTSNNGNTNGYQRRQQNNYYNSNQINIKSIINQVTNQVINAVMDNINTKSNIFHKRTTSQKQS